MSATRLAQEVARAARRPAAARTLLLDLDGTLAPIRPTPEEVEVPPATLRAIAELVARGWSVAIVSGRPSSQVRRLVPLRGVRVFGSHGMEGTWDGRPAPRVPAGLRRRLAGLARKGARLAARVPGARLERKRMGLAFHDRNVPAGKLRAWRAALDRWVEEQDLAGLEVVRGKRVLEIRPEGAGKGRVVRTLPPSRRRRGAGGASGRDASLVAVGDDRTDEDMFRELRGRGLAVRVGRPRAGTAAHRRLPSPRAVRRFLESLARGQVLA